MRFIEFGKAAPLPTSPVEPTPSSAELTALPMPPPPPGAVTVDMSSPQPYGGAVSGAALTTAQPESWLVEDESLVLVEDVSDDEDASAPSSSQWTDPASGLDIFLVHPSAPQPVVLSVPPRLPLPPWGQIDGASQGSSLGG